MYLYTYLVVWEISKNFDWWRNFGQALSNKTLLPRFEINCDMGEGYGRWKMGPDDEIMPYIDSANIACGFHAGDYNIMKKTVKLAKQYNVKVGSHPGLPDKIGFGRRPWEIAPEEIYNLIIYQTGALYGFLKSEGMELSYIKPHGQLYFYIEQNEDVMRAALKAAKTFNVPIVGAKNAHYEQIAKEEGVPFIQEFYCDIDWNSEGNLVLPAKSQMKTPQEIYDSIYKCGTTGSCFDNNGEELNIGFGDAPFSVCLHSDMPTALENVIKAREAIDKVNKQLGFSLKT
ncbi:hypothetical protein PACTADRAFT_73219 [Pachysolen tannophilus NRRL Y-2460]|uniref:Lactam utilization protein lamB n=1 Tax=Pachysolen tannophilus NRRL Y-2460 TaxID=669874 RepID=A0A1E4U0M7_PACTA|nr:hypothetical protein PACTADRAFT_73219 [Pachysolen tannophilus NRRL Y-2460]